jgi:hypothetical protein
MINKTFLAFAAPERNRRAIFHSTSIADWGGELLLGRVGKCMIEHELKALPDS